MGLVFRNHVWERVLDLLGENMQVDKITKNKNTNQMIKGQTVFGQIWICILLLLSACSDSLISL